LPFKISSKHYSSNHTIETKVIVYSEKHVNKTAGCKFDNREVHICLWKNDCNSVFSSKQEVCALWNLG
jgi:hypothetical protein